MPRIGLRELKIHLSEVIRDVQDNNSFTITNRESRCALLVPYSRGCRDWAGGIAPLLGRNCRPTS